MTPTEKRLTRELAEVKSDLQFLAQRAGNFEKLTNERSTPKPTVSTAERITSMLRAEPMQRRSYEGPVTTDWNKLGKAKACGKFSLSNGLTRLSEDLSNPIEFNPQYELRIERR